jgi:NYN domain
LNVGVYIDGFNLYYGGRNLCGRGRPGWRWLDLEALGATLANRPPTWAAQGPVLTRLVYCTAPISGIDNPVGHSEQDAYLKALQAHGTVTHIEYGQYVSRVKTAPLAVEGKNRRPRLVKSRWPVKVQDRAKKDVPSAVFMVSYARREEKASDVNVAGHLLIDTLEGTIEAALVISNDSDLAFPLREARKRVPVGTVNPSPTYMAGQLKGRPTDGVGGHWWIQLTAADFLNHQLPDPCRGHQKPVPW